MKRKALTTRSERSDDSIGQGESCKDPSSVSPSVSYIKTVENTLKCLTLPGRILWKTPRTNGWMK